MKAIVLALSVLCAVSAQAVCPSNIPEVVIPAHQAGGFSWGNVIRPMNDACISYIAVDPSNNAAWYAAGPNGVYMTKNYGLTWTKPLSGNVNVLLLVEDQPNYVYAAIGTNLYLTQNSGTSWTLIKTFSKAITSLFVDGILYIGLAYDNHIQPSGIYISTLTTSLMAFKSFGPGHTGLIVWSITKDPVTGTLYAGGEIWDHPQPYHPPFFRSNDSGNTWVNIGATLPWHVVESAVRPTDGYLYTLLEGPGLWGSPNQGSSWFAPSNSLGLGIALKVDKLNPSRLYAGRQKYSTLNGGLFMSTNAGISFNSGGLLGVTISDIALNGANTRIYAAAYGSGIYVSPVP